MEFRKTPLQDVLLIVPEILGDHRGWFVEIYRDRTFAENGIPQNFVQDNMSLSRKGVLRGMHYQVLHPQGKLVRVIKGEVYDVALDIRRGSPTFGMWHGEILSAENRHMLWIPPGLAHGFCVLSDEAQFEYKCSDYYYPEHERGIAWNDPAVGIDWPISEPILSGKDRIHPPLSEAELTEYMPLPKAE